MSVWVLCGSVDVYKRSFSKIFENIPHLLIVAQIQHSYCLNIFFLKGHLSPEIRSLCCLLFKRIKLPVWGFTEPTCCVSVLGGQSEVDREESCLRTRGLEGRGRGRLRDQEDCQQHKELPLSPRPLGLGLCFPSAPHPPQLHNSDQSFILSSLSLEHVAS